jgi:hypothetical protein
LRDVLRLTDAAPKSQPINPSVERGRPPKIARKPRLEVPPLSVFRLEMGLAIVLGAEIALEKAV